MGAMERDDKRTKLIVEQGSIGTRLFTTTFPSPLLIKAVNFNLRGLATLRVDYRQRARSSSSGTSTAWSSGIRSRCGRREVIFSAGFPACTSCSSGVRRIYLLPPPWRLLLPRTSSGGWRGCWGTGGLCKQPGIFLSDPLLTLPEAGRQARHRHTLAYQAARSLLRPAVVCSAGAATAVEYPCTELCRPSPRGPARQTWVGGEDTVSGVP